MINSESIFGFSKNLEKSSILVGQPYPTFLLGFLRVYGTSEAEALQKYVFDACEHETFTESRFKFTDFEIKLIDNENN